MYILKDGKSSKVRVISMGRFLKLKDECSQCLELI